ncbi:MAG: hypothetical protein UHW60_00885 [Methanobrevibacter sp.]|nr:hypothetical protein [Methanobrevibacter sp.]
MGLNRILNKIHDIFEEPETKVRLHKRMNYSETNRDSAELLPTYPGSTVNVLLYPYDMDSMPSI